MTDESGRSSLIERVCGGVLVGGRSRRMGRDKAELLYRGRSLLEISLAALGGLERIALVGESRVVPNPALERVPDAPGVVGPLAGLIGALRSEPQAAWVVLACDLPRVEPRVVDWLIAQRDPEFDAVLPRVGGRAQPLVALYEPSALPRLEALGDSGEPAPSRLAGQRRVALVAPPDDLLACFVNVNTPEQLAAL